MVMGAVCMTGRRDGGQIFGDGTAIHLALCQGELLKLYGEL